MEAPTGETLMPHPTRWTDAQMDELMAQRSEGRTIDWCAEYWGVTQARICQIQKRARARAAKLEVENDRA